MKKFITAVIIIFVLGCIITQINCNEHFYQVPNRNLLGATINGHLTTDKIKRYNSDPNEYYLNDGLLIQSPYNNLIKNSFTNNVKKSLAFASIKEILNDTKTILNDNKSASIFDYENVVQLKPSLNDFKPLLNIIFNGINTVAKKYYLIKPQKLYDSKLFQSKNKYLFTVEILSHVTNYDDDINEKNIQDFDKIHQMDTMTQKNPMIVKIIIQILMTKINDDIDIYINNISVLTNNDELL